ncbi:hypothetical protein HYPSUDRAFT_215669 [Hypholoma sublateritium FD-334 SS-4]|uniref:Uncharacterized protein n=1 Tax=Hypholoma sublateritium (strain FD-334 SS-4) TaxID=945553 RepID=A0A0D2PSI8_HYPSF|nr:hypothetical protein HYPSUDRAFT_215669 [Hypholoma sublateritium FD-334 SS-4]
MDGGAAPRYGVCQIDARASVPFVRGEKRFWYTIFTRPSRPSPPAAARAAPPRTLQKPAAHHHTLAQASVVNPPSRSTRASDSAREYQHIRAAEARGEPHAVRDAHVEVANARAAERGVACAEAVQQECEGNVAYPSSNADLPMSHLLSAPRTSTAPAGACTCTIVLSRTSAAAELRPLRRPKWPPGHPYASSTQPDIAWARPHSPSTPRGSCMSA